jgi:hypothetical protein
MDFEFEMRPEPSAERVQERAREARGEAPWVYKPSFQDTSFSKCSGPDLLPKQLPSSEALGMDVNSLLEAVFSEGLYEEQVRAVIWTIALENAFQREKYAQEMPGFRTATYGFFDPETEADGFGVIAYVAPSLYGVPRGEFRWVSVDDQSFSVIVRPANWRLHAPTVHPALGTSTCWAKSRRPTLKSKSGILTAKHVVGKPAIGSAVPLTSGHGTLLDLAPEGIDAALVQVPSSNWPGSPGTLNCQKFVAQWSDVDVYSPSGQFSTKVTEVSSGRGTLDPSIPLRIFLANPGQSGDSGALVMDSAGRGIGLYMGEVTTPANLQEGFCQHLGQVESSMAVDLFH